ncbi:hypothetical protein T4D_13641 [Trichinella pseudospiralis]|uniref:Uncharacterized protein n=1 Tax=Trichinella pseudospiralis TaxID=6337 RepID=A0A0V1DNL7_TRIPS|nr:hypothetical protein T4D_13641 [Trichinella pseudospiralis]
MNCGMLKEEHEILYPTAIIGRHQITLLHRFTDNSARKQLLGSLENCRFVTVRAKQHPGGYYELPSEGSTVPIYG